jgi:hypothetical protein
MEIKDQLVEILTKENYTYKQLAEFLYMSEEDLNNLREKQVANKEKPRYTPISQISPFILL